MPSAPGGTRTVPAAIGALLLVALVVGLYAPAFWFDFTYDDRNIILRNEVIRSWSGLAAAFKQDIWAFDPWKGGHGSYYRPLATIGLTVGWHLAGTVRAGWHAMCLFFHLTSIAGVVLLARTAGRPAGVGWLAALVFAVHPVQINDVAMASGWLGPLTTTLMQASLLCWRRAFASPRRASLVTAAAGLYLLALLSQERALPFLMAFVWFDPRGGLADDVPATPVAARLRGLALRALPFVGAILVAAAMRLATTARAPGGNGLPLGTVVLTAPHLAVAYLRNLVVPTLLGLAYPIGYVSAAGVRVAAEALLVLAVAAAAVVVVRRRPFARACALTAATLLLVPLDAAVLSPGALVQDRYLYQPLAFIALALADVVVDSTKWRRAALAAVGVWVAWLVVVHRSNLEPWRNNLALYGRAIDLAPESPRFLVNLANARRAAGLEPGDCPTYRAAVAALGPDAGGDPVTTHYDAGNCERAAGRLEAAVGHYRAALAASGGAFLPAWHNLVIGLMDAHREGDALAEADRLTGRAPGFAGGWSVRAVALARLGRLEEAEASARRSLALDARAADAAALLAQIQKARAAAPP